MRNINPVQPEMLKKRVLRSETMHNKVIPEGVPEIKVAVNIGTSDISNLRNGRTGREIARHITANTKDIAAKTEFNAIRRM
jgi:hypothetical protein